METPEQKNHHNKEGSMKCSVSLCDNEVKHRGMCEAHHRRKLHTGTTDASRAPPGTGRPTNSAGYVTLMINKRRVYEHVYLAEKALGKKLPPKVVVHHMNKIKDDNFTPFNLIICPTQAYHKLLHMRAEALGFA